MSDMSRYVSDGTFRSELERFGGPLSRPDEAPDADDLEGVGEAIALLPADVAREVRALVELSCGIELPSLCRLRWSGFCTMPQQHDMNRDEVVEEWFGGVESEHVDVFMRSVEILNDQGNPFLLVGEKGVYVAYDDPFEVRLICASLGQFLHVLVRLAGVKNGTIDAETARAERDRHILDHFGKDRFESFLRRTLPA